MIRLTLSLVLFAYCLFTAAFLSGKLLQAVLLRALPH